MYNKIREVDEVAAEDFLKIIMENPQPYDSDYERCYYRRNAAYYLNQRFYWQLHKPTRGSWWEVFDKLRQNQYGGHNQ